MLSDLKFAFRQFAMFPGFTVVAVLILTLGIGACTALFSIGGGMTPLLGAMGIMLLIAIANIAILLCTRSTARKKEISVRLALGASRIRIVRQLLSESALLAVLGGFLGTLVASWGIEAFVTFAPHNIPRAREIALNARTFVFAGGLAFSTGIGFGLFPALQASRINLNEGLKDGRWGTGAGRRRLRAASVLVAAEVALALILLVGAGLLGRSFTHLPKVSPGFQLQNALVVTLPLPNSKFGTSALRAAFVVKLTDNIAALNGVKSAGATSVLPFSAVEDTTYFKIAGQSTGVTRVQTAFCVVTPDYFKAIGIPLVRGRFFNEHDTGSAAPVAIINESMARRFFPGKDPIGQHLNITYGTTDSTSYSEIVGIVGDVNSRKLDEEEKVQTYEPFAQRPSNYVNLVVRNTGADPDLPAAIRATIHSLEEEQPIESLRPLVDLLAASLICQRFALYLFVVFACFALLLTAVGIYSMVAYSVAQRTCEISIRMALGAQRADVVRLISLQGGRAVAIGLIGGLVGARLLTRLISSMLFGVSAQDPITFTAMAALLAAVTGIACLIPVLRATKVDPITALRVN